MRSIILSATLTAWLKDGLFARGLSGLLPQGIASPARPLDFSQLRIFVCGDSILPKLVQQYVVLLVMHSI